MQVSKWSCFPRFPAYLNPADWHYWMGFVPIQALISVHTLVFLLLFLYRVISCKATVPFFCILTLSSLIHCGTFPHLWPSPITMAIGINLQLAVLGKSGHSLLPRKLCSAPRERKKGDLETLWFPCWYTASWAHFCAFTVPRFSGLVIRRSLAGIFVLSVCSSVTQAVGPVKLKKFGV